MKKVLSMILCIVFITTLLPIVPFTAQAAEGIDWNLNNGVLIISGSGEMSFDTTTVPWYYYRNQIHEVIINPGITSIQAEAFSGHTVLEEVTIPNSVTSIGDNAFYDCRSLQYIVIPKSVTELGEYAFSYSGLKWIRIPSSIKTVSKGAFYHCKSLTRFELMSGVTKIGEEAFAQSDLRNFFIPNTVTEIDKKAFFGCSNLQNATIRNDNISIGEYAFLDCKNVTICCNKDSAASVYAKQNGHSYAQGTYTEGLNWWYEDGLLYIHGTGEMYFDTIPWESYKDEIKTIYITNWVTSIQAEAFKGYPALEEVQINGLVETIGEGAFSDCPALKRVVLCNFEKKSTSGVTEIDDYAFAGCPALESIHIPGGTSRIGKGAFENCVKLERVIIRGKTGIEKDAFSGCDNLTMTCYDNSPAKNYANENNIKCLMIKERGTYGTDVFWVLDEEGTLTVSGSGNVGDELSNDTPWNKIKSNIKKVIISEGINSLGRYPFYDCENLEIVELPSSLEDVGNVAFGGTTKVKEVHIKDLAAWCGVHFDGSAGNPLSAGAKLYVNDEPVEGSVVIPEGVKIIGTHAFYNYKYITELTLPDGLDTVYHYAFDYCTFTKVKIPASLQNIGTHAFFSTNERDVYIDDLNAWCIASAFGGGGYNLYLNNELVTHIVIPDGTTEIERYKFFNCKSIEKVTIPESVNYIRLSAFEDCTGIKEVHIEDLDAWYNMAFEKHPSSAAYGNNNPMQYGADLYLNGELVTEITQLKKIKNHAFYGCTSLKSVSFAEGVTGVSAYAFYKCSNLEEVTMPETVVSIGIDAFEETPYRSSSKSYGDDGVLYGGKCVVAAKPNITKADIKEGTVSIAPRAFKDCTNLKTITFPESLTTIGKEAFMFCDSLDKVEIHEGITALRDGAFWGCRSLRDITIYGKDTKIEGFWYLVPADLIITCQPDSTAKTFATKQEYRYRYIGTANILGGNVINNPSSIGGGGGGGGSSKPKVTVGLTNFKNANSYDNTFADVAQDAWYQDSVKVAYELDLVKGAAEGKFNPDGNMTIAEAVTLAARIHSIYNTGKAEFTQGDIWYQVYVDYAIKNGIIAKDQFSDFNLPATRAEFAEIFAKAIPEKDYNAINKIEAGDIPDVAENAAIYILYNAGIVAGSDEAHSFKPETNIKRCEVATIITRIVNKENRVKFEI